MKSGATYHFPPVVFHQGKKVLWNRLGKKPLVNRPEERVRLRYLDYLTLECGWPGSKIAVEPGVERTERGSQTRADLICYDKQVNPSILIECKSESVVIGQQAAEQVAMYNQTVQAGQMCITNGINDFWFELNGDKLQELNKPPLESTRMIMDIRSDPGYWKERGFTGTRMITNDTSWITETLQIFWSVDHPWQSRYLDIHQLVEGLKVDHYYRLAETADGNRIAMTFIAGFDGNTYLVAILNRDGQNRALIVSNLNDAAAKRKDNSLLITVNGSYGVNIEKKIPFDFKNQSDGVVYNLPGFLEALFHQKL